MKPAIRFMPTLLLLLSPVPSGAEPAASEQTVRTFPQPVLLDWGGQFRLNAPPNNADPADLKEAAAAAEARSQRPTIIEPPARSEAALGPDDPAKARFSTRPIVPGENRLSVGPPVSAGPVSLGASYGKYRAVPNNPSREVSAQDARVTLGVAF